MTRSAYLRCSLATFSLALTASTFQAHADWYQPLVRITFVPEASYVAIETFGEYDIEEDAIPRLNAHGIYLLSNRTDTCRLLDGELTIEFYDYHPPQAKGVCGAVQDASLRISFQGKQVIDVRGTHGGCSGSQRYDIPAMGDVWLR
ncbi:MAG: hypothetical protein HYU58_08280 [Proteobacteria bacterium]|nr:hypothetical protein [Pseudomonadota bacterium]